MSNRWLTIREWTAPVFNHRFGLVAVLYIIGLLALVRPWPVKSASGGTVGQPKPSAVCGNTTGSCWTAKAPLPHNHLIAHGDLRPQESLTTTRLGFYLDDSAKLEGKYVQPQSIPAGAAVTAEKLMEKPDLTLDSQSAAIDFPIPADSRLGQILDAGTQVTLEATDSDAKTTISVPATVMAMVCIPSDKGAQPACDAVLKVPSKQRDPILKNKSSLQAALGWADESKGENANGTTGVAQNRIGTSGSRGPGPSVDGGARTGNTGKKHQD